MDIEMIMVFFIFFFGCLSLFLLFVIVVNFLYFKILSVMVLRKLVVLVFCGWVEMFLNDKLVVYSLLIVKIVSFVILIKVIINERVCMNWLFKILIMNVIIRRFMLSVGISYLVFWELNNCRI